MNKKSMPKGKLIGLCTLFTLLLCTSMLILSGCGPQEVYPLENIEIADMDGQGFDRAYDSNNITQSDIMNELWGPLHQAIRDSEK